MFSHLEDFKKKDSEVDIVNYITVYFIILNSGMFD